MRKDAQPRMLGGLIAGIVKSSVAGGADLFCSFEAY
jgi:hypothetical protein